MSDVVSFFEIVADATIFASAFDRAKAKAAEFGAEWMKMSRQVAVGAAEVDAATAKVGRSAPKVSGLGLSLTGLQAAAYGLLALGAVAFGVLAISQRLVQNFAEFSSQILRNSQAMHINTADLQTWERIAGLVGMDQQSLVTMFARFSKNLAEGAPALRAANIDLQHLGITSRDTGTAVLQLADYFHSHTDAGEKAAIATALFGRAGAELIPILDQGSAAVQRYKAQLEAAGVILSNNQLLQGAQAKASMTEFTNAFDAAKNELVGGALPGFTVFFRTLSIIIENNAGLWKLIGDVITYEVMWITGLMAGLAGVSLKDILSPPKDAGAAYEGLGAGASGAAGGLDSAAAAAQRATAALDAHIQRLRDAKRAQDQLYDTEKQGLQDQLDQLRDVNDSRRRSGEDIISYQRRLEELGLQDKIKAIDKAKSTYDRSVDNHIAALEKEKAAVKNASGAMANDLIGGMNTAGAGMGKSMATTLSKLQLQTLTSAHQMGADINAIFTGDQAKRTKAVQDIGELLGQAFIGSFLKGVVLGTAGWEGSMLLNLLGIHPGTGSAGSFAGSLIHHKIPPTHADGTARTSEGLAYLHRDEAVIPLHNRARSLSLLAQTGLGALARSAGGPSGSSGAGHSTVINVHFSGPVADELVADRVISRIDKKMRQRGFGLTRGI